MLKVSTYFGLFLIFLSRLSACKFHLNSQLEGQKTLRSLINILQTPPHGDTVTQAYTTNTMRTISTRSSRKIENKSQLTYKNLNMKMIQTLRRRLNALPPLRNEPWDVRLPSAGVQTVCPKRTCSCERREGWHSSTLCVSEFSRLHHLGH